MSNPWLEQEIRRLQARKDPAPDFLKLPPGKKDKPWKVEVVYRFLPTSRWTYRRVARLRSEEEAKQWIARQSMKHPYIEEYNITEVT